MVRHLTPEEIMQAADRDGTDGLSPDVADHRRQCPVCSREVEFQKALRSVTGHGIPLQVRASFTDEVLTRVGVEANPGLLRRLLDNAGSLLALATVFGLSGAIVSALGSFDWSRTSTPSPLADALASGTHSVRSFISSALGSLPSPGLHPASPDSSSQIMAIVAALLVLVAMDLVIGRVNGRAVFRRRQR